VTLSAGSQSQAATQDFFTGVTQEQVLISGRAFPAPVFYRDLSFDAYVYECDTATVQKFLPSPSYLPIRLPFRKCLTALICFEYRATDVEPYNEVALCVPLAGFGEHLLPDWLFSFLDLSLGTLHAHIIHLPVNTDLALRGGLDFFGYPKFLAGIHFEDKQKKHSCELRDADDNFLTLRISRERGRGIALGPQAMTFCTYPVRRGKTLRATFNLQFDDMHVDALPRHIRLETGAGEMAEAAGLLLTTPLMSVYARKGRGILQLPAVSQPSAIGPTAGWEASSRLEEIHE